MMITPFQKYLVLFIMSFVSCDLISQPFHLHQTLLEEQQNADFSNARFGQTVSLDDQTLVIKSLNQKGLLRIFEKQINSQEWVNTSRIDPEEFDEIESIRSAKIDGAHIIASGTDQPNETNKRVVFIFSKNENNPSKWNLVKKIKEINEEEYSIFGFSYDISGDFAVIGVEDDTTKVLIYGRHKDGVDNWGLISKINLPHEHPINHSNIQVSISGDNIIASTNMSTGSESNSGIAYIYSKNVDGNNQWSLRKKLETYNDWDFFGFKNQLDGDIALISAPLDWIEGTDLISGSVHIHLKDFGGQNNWGFYQRIFPSDGANYDWFGKAIAVAQYKIAVLGGSNIYYYEKNSINSQYEETHKITVEEDYEGFFSSQLALDEQTIFHGTPRNNILGHNSGSVQIYKSCQPSYVGDNLLSDTISSSMMFQASSIVNSSHTIVLGPHQHYVKYQAGEEIELLPNFEVNQGVTFLSEINACVMN